MTARKERSRKAKTGVGSRSRSRSGGRKPERRDIGWGLTADEQEGIFLRRVIFSVLVVVVGCVGAWFVRTALTDPREEQRVLSATGSPPAATGSYTVKLLEFSPSKQEFARQLASTEAVRSLAGEHEFRFLELPDGRKALCVGQFEGKKSPQMHQLLRAFRSFDAQGKRLFEGASICKAP